MICFDGGHTLFRHLVFLLDWPTRSVYYADLVREVLSLGAMLLNYVHMWACYGIHFTLFDVLLFEAARIWSIVRGASSSLSFAVRSPALRSLACALARLRLK